MANLRAEPLNPSERRPPRLARRLHPYERPKQRNAKRVAVLDADAIATLVAAGSSERWRAALGLAG